MQFEAPQTTKSFETQTPTSRCVQNTFYNNNGKATTRDDESKDIQKYCERAAPYPN